MSLGLILLFVLTLSETPAERCMPAGVVRIETADMTPGLPADSFARKPKVLYRSGRLYARIEESADSEHGIHGLIVVHAPDSWMVNLLGGTGRHIVDPDPVPGVRTPVFQAQEQAADFPKQFLDLDFGCELAFFDRSHAVQLPHQAGGIALTKHVLTSGPWRLTLLTGATDTTPQALVLSKDEKVTLALKYLSYTQRADVPPDLFAKPAGITFDDK